MGESFTPNNNFRKPDANQVGRYQDYNFDWDQADQGFMYQPFSASAFDAYVPVTISAVPGLSAAYVVPAAAGMSAIGVALIPIGASGATVQVLLWGIITNPGWALLIGRTVYVGNVRGTITQTPTSELLGVAIKSDTIILFPPPHFRW